MGRKLAISALTVMALPASAPASAATQLPASAPASAATQLPASAPASAATKPPTSRQVRAAVIRAKHSRYLWATINICNTRAHPESIGIRGQMPALGFPARLTMTIQVDYWITAAKAFQPVPGSNARAVVRLGTVTDGLQQGGRTFRFKSGAGLLSGTITFQWVRMGKVIGRISKQATGGHHGVDGGDPPHHSAATCTIP